MFDLKRQVRVLVLCNMASWCLMALLLLNRTTIKAQERDRTRFREIDVERINIVGTNDKPVLVLSNRRMIAGPSINGKDYPRELADGRDLLSGMIFFNEQGDEVGGLIFNGIKKDSGYSAVGHLSFDQWKQNQVVALQYIDNGTSRRAGLGVWDRPTDVTLDKQLDRALKMMKAKGEERAALQKEIETAKAKGEFGVQRVFVGSRDGSAQVTLHDTKGRVRARLSVDSNDMARLEFLDDSGQVVAKYPSPNP